MTHTLLLVDAYSMIYRAFFAIRSLTGPQGQPVNAIYGFTKMLRKLLADHRPSHSAVVFDLGSPRQRLAILPSYKEQRPPTPPDLDAQLPAIRGVLDALRIPVVEVDGEEADDLIATLAVTAARQQFSVLIASNDKDFTQLVTHHITLLRPGTDAEATFDAAAVEARYGVRPDQMVDYLSLVGDNVDNIPGVPGVGEKTAAELLRRYGALDALLSRVDEVSKVKLRDALKAATDRLRTNRTLIALRTDLPVPIAVEGLKTCRPDYDRLTAQLKQLGFKSLVAELEKESQQTDDLFAQP